MFSIGRLMTFAALGLLVYMGFFAVPPGERADGRYDADRLAASEVAVWQAAQAREEIAVFTSLVVMLREQHRYSWFRAAHAGFYLARATTAFAGMKTRYERVLPDLEDAASIHKAWMDAAFDPAAVARAQLTWWVTRGLPNLNSVDQLAPLIADEYVLRYRISSAAAMDAAIRRAQACVLFDSTESDPNVPTITKLLAESYRSLQRTITARRGGQ